MLNNSKYDFHEMLTMDSRNADFKTAVGILDGPDIEIKLVREARVKSSALLSMCGRSWLRGSETREAPDDVGVGS